VFIDDWEVGLKVDWEVKLGKPYEVVVIVKGDTKVVV